MLHHQLYSNINLPENYKLGYKVTKYKNFQHYSCVVKDIITRTGEYIFDQKYYHYKWTEAPSINYPLFCFDSYLSAREFYYYNILGCSCSLSYYIMPCVYVLSIYETIKWEWSYKHTYLVNLPKGTVLASKIMLVGDMIIPKGVL